MRRVIAPLALLLLSGCYDWVAVGDSILYGQEDELRAELGDNGVLDALIARDAAPDVVDRLVDRLQPGGWLIVQDDGGSATVESYRAYVDHVVEVTPDDRCILWVLPFSVWQPERDARFRDEIQAGLEAHPCHATIPWHEVAAAHPEEMTTDGLHPTEAGHRWIVAAIGEAVGQP